ncbi:MAG: methyltransferase domain-containing protein [Candidatus Omnitrophica bacterium]|nr:methyltransferase domain-containing protein [Candidatus Omnitrophota bacterium]
MFFILMDPYEYKTSRIDRNTGMLYPDLAEARVCPLCGSPESRKLFVKEGFRFVSCEKCGMVYTGFRAKEDRHEKEEYSEKLRNKDHEAALSADSPKKIRLERLLRKIEKRFGGRKDLRILDIGSGSGISFYFASRKGYSDFYAVDINPGAVEVARERFGARAFLGDLREHGLESGFFDVVIMDNVLEHLNDPCSTLEEAARVLNEKGMLFVSVPNIDSFIIRALGKNHRFFNGFGHLNYFTPKTLAKLSSACGLTPYSVETAVEEMTVSRLFNLMAKRNLIDYDIGSIEYHESKKAPGASSVDKKRESAVKTAAKRACAPIDAVLVLITNLMRRGAYIDAVFVKKQ